MRKNLKTHNYFLKMKAINLNIYINFYHLPVRSLFEYSEAYVYSPTTTIKGNRKNGIWAVPVISLTVTAGVVRFHTFGQHKEQRQNTSLILQYNPNH